MHRNQEGGKGLSDEIFFSVLIIEVEKKRLNLKGEQKMKNLIIVTLILGLIPTVFAAPVDFDNLQVASTSYGIVAGEKMPRLMAAYNNEIYFIVSRDGTANPSKVCRYNPSDGLSNAVNHTILVETTGKFVMLRQINNLLYFSDNLGNVYVYDGSILTTMSGTPFTSSDHVSSIVEFNGLMYYATSTGNIFRYDELAFEQVGDISEDRYIIDMVAWEKNGYMYVSVGNKNVCCPPTGYLIRSSTGEPSSWATVFSGFWGVYQILPTPDYLYAGVVDTAYSHSSTVRKSSDGTTFPIIYPSDGQYKRAWGSFYYDGIAYFFTDDRSGGLGERILDDNGSVSRILNQNWTLTQAVALNGGVYALASSPPGEQVGDVYLITTVSEPPCTFSDDFEGTALDTSLWSVFVDSLGQYHWPYVADGLLHSKGYHTRIDSIPAFAAPETGQSVMARASINLAGEYHKFGFAVNPMERDGPITGYYFDTVDSSVGEGLEHHVRALAWSNPGSGSMINLLNVEIPVTWYEFHEFAIERTPSEVIFSIDGQEVARVADAFGGALPVGVWNDRWSLMQTDWVDVCRSEPPAGTTQIRVID